MADNEHTEFVAETSSLAVAILGSCSASQNRYSKTSNSRDNLDRPGAIKAAGVEMADTAPELLLHRGAARLCPTDRNRSLLWLD